MYHQCRGQHVGAHQVSGSPTSEETPLTWGMVRPLLLPLSHEVNPNPKDMSETRPSPGWDSKQTKREKGA